eukprot:gene3366-5913_t
MQQQFRMLSMSNYTKKYEHEIQKILDMGKMIDTIQKGICIRHPVDFRFSSEPKKSLEIICFKFSVDIFNAYLNRTIMYDTIWIISPFRVLFLSQINKCRIKLYITFGQKIESIKKIEECYCQKDHEFCVNYVEFNSISGNSLKKYSENISTKTAKTFHVLYFTHPLGTSSEIQFLSQRKTISQTESENESRTEASAIYHPTQLSYMCGYCGDEMGFLEDSHRICINVSCRNYKNKDDLHIENLWKL